MTKVLSDIHHVWQRIALRATSLSFKQVFLASAFLFCLFPANFMWLTSFDKSLAALISKMSGIHSGPAELGLVIVPEQDMAEWESDFYSADRLALLVSNVLHSSSATVGLLLDRPLGSHLTTLDTHLRTAQSIDDETLQMLNRKYYLQELLQDPRVVLGLKQHSRLPIKQASDFAHLNFDSKVIDPIAFVRMWYQLCPQCDQSIKGLRQTSLIGSNREQFFPSQASIDDLIFLPSEGDALEERDLDTNFIFAMAKQTGSVTESARLNHADTLAWLPWHATHAAHKPKIVELSLDDALLVNAFPRYVIVTSENNTELARQKASVLYSVVHKNVFVVPWWGEPAGRILLLLFILYRLFIHVRIKSVRIASLALVLFFVGSIGSIAAIALLFSWWLPFSLALSLAVLSIPVTSVWNTLRLRQSFRQRELSLAVNNAAKLLENHQHLNEAMVLAAHHPDKSVAVEKINRFANKLEEERAPPRHVITMISSLLPLVDNDAQLTHKISALKKTIIGQNLASTQVSASPEYIDQAPSKLGRYEVQREIGRGAVGVVYLGYDPAISRNVAIKTLDGKQFSSEQHGSLKLRFFREAEAAGRLSHPNIVSVFDVGEEGDLAFIAMDYVEGKALNEFIAEESLLPVAEVYRIAHDVAVALAYAHENQIVHRDIKPGNIMFSEEPFAVKVADFGIARLLDNSKTSTGEILGSPLYMSPEQLKGSKVGPTADVFSLGVTFYQLLTGQLPFNADNLASLTYEIIHTKHKGVKSVRKDLPASAARIINQCLQKRADERYESAAELAAVLKKAIKRDFPAEAKRWLFV